MNFTDRIVVSKDRVEEFVREMNEGNSESRQRVKTFIQKNAPGELNFDTDSLFEVVEEKPATDKGDSNINKVHWKIKD